MVNDARIAAGKSTIGFINPTVSETPGNTACRDKAFPVDLFLSVRWCLQRYYHGKQPRMWNQRIQRHSRLGPCDWSRNAQLAQAAPSLARASLRDRGHRNRTCLHWVSCIIFNLMCSTWNKFIVVQSPRFYMCLDRARSLAALTIHTSGLLSLVSDTEIFNEQENGGNRHWTSGSLSSQHPLTSGTYWCNSEESLWPLRECSLGGLGQGLFSSLLGSLVLTFRAHPWEGKVDITCASSRALVSASLSVSAFMHHWNLSPVRTLHENR